jgi:hypothetical protein
MLKLPIAAWIRNAAAVLCHRYGAVTDRAAEADCSRQTLYDHAQRLLAQVARHEQERAAWQAERARLLAERDAARQQVREAVRLGAEELERFAVTSQALGVSLRQAEELLGALLPAERVPDHATLGRWAQAAGRRAGEVLRGLDPLCTAAAQTLCVDEIFFGGWRRWWRWSRPA